MCKDEVKSVLDRVERQSAEWIQHDRTCADLMNEVRDVMNRMEPRLSDSEYALVIQDVVSSLCAMRSSR